MNKLFKIISLVVVLILVAVVLGTQVVGALRNAAAPSALPYGLSMQDTMASVEQKFGQPKVVQAPQAGWTPGLPDAGSSPDRIHYWAVYERFGVTIVYNTPFANDKNATIRSILVTK